MPPRDERPLSSAFLAHVEDGVARENLSASPDLEHELEQLFQQGRLAWPGVVLPVEEFLAYTAARVPASADADQLFGRLHAEGIYLACACARGNAEAIALFERHLFREVDAAAARLGKKVAVDELKQQLRELLFVGERGNPPVITNYSGRGRIGRWLRVLAFRTGLAQINAGREQPRDDNALLRALPADQATPELRYLKGIYRREFKSALQEALGSLDERARNVLRYSVLHGLSIDRIGAIYRVHRATAARWLVQAREDVLAKTRTSLMGRLRVDNQEFESIMRLINSQLDVSIERLLASDPEARRTPDELAEDEPEADR